MKSRFRLYFCAPGLKENLCLQRFRADGSDHMLRGGKMRSSFHSSNQTMTGTQPPVWTNSFATALLFVAFIIEATAWPFQRPVICLCYRFQQMPHSTAIPQTRHGQPLCRPGWHCGHCPRRQRQSAPRAPFQHSRGSAPRHRVLKATSGGRGEKRRYALSKEWRHCWFIPQESRALLKIALSSRHSAQEDQKVFTEAKL